MTQAAATLKTEAALEQLQKGIQELTTSGKWENYLQSQARFYKYSFGNVLLIAMQRPDATRVAGFHAWEAFNRRVSKGAKGIHILAPNVRKVEDKDTKEVRRILTGFRVTYVFDVADTEGEPLPEVATRLTGDAPEHVFPQLVTFAESIGFTVDRKNPGRAGANGVCNFVSKSISVRDDLSPTQSVKTLAHELGHAVLHSDAVGDPSARGDMELEAESVAFVVCHGLGVDSGAYSFGYVKAWAGKTDAVKTIKTSGTRIQKTARQILDSISVETKVLQEVA